MRALLRMLATGFHGRRSSEHLSFERRRADREIAEPQSSSERLAEVERELRLVRGDRDALRRRLCEALHDLRRLREQSAVKDGLIVELAHRGHQDGLTWKVDDPGFD